MKQYERQPRTNLKSLSTVLLSSILFIAAQSVLSASPKKVIVDDSSNGQIIQAKFFTNYVKPLKAQDYEREVDIYLPAAYVNDESRTLRFPVAYLLHGSPGKPTDFVHNGEWQEHLEQASRADGFLPPILVAPDGNYTAAAFGDSEWLNSADGENRFEDYIINQVVPWIDQHYRTIATAQGRVIGGVSEGGYGAVNIALHAPNIFGNVLALSGYYINDGSGWARKTMGHNKDFLSFNSPLTFIDSPEADSRLAGQWQTQHYFIGSGLSESRYSIESAEMVDKLRAHKISADLCQVEGKHSWELWNALFIAGLANIYSPEKKRNTVEIPPVPVQNPI